MEKTYFAMKPQFPGQIKYILLAALPSIAIGLLIGWDAAAWVLILLTGILLFPKSHSIVVFDDSLTEKALFGSKRFIRKVRADQIEHYYRNFLGEIVLVDADSKKLLCIESNMTNRDRFEQWLTAHHIESK